MAVTESNGRERPDISGWDELLVDVQAVDQPTSEALLWDLVALLDEARSASAQMHRICGDLRRRLDADRVALGAAL